MVRSIVRCASVGFLAAGCLLLLGANATSPPAASVAPPGSPAAAPAPGKPILIVPVHGVIDTVQGAFLHRALRDVRKQYAAVIFDIDTPGGRIDIMSKMSDEILKLEVPTISFVSKWAVSAGSFIAMSADRIYMTPQSQIGAARAILIGPKGIPAELPKSVEEKFASVNRAQFRALAETKGYPPAIAEAMTDESISVTKVDYDGKIMYVKGDELKKLQSDPLKNDKLKIIEVVVDNKTLVALTGREAVKFDIARKLVKDLDEMLALPDVNLAGARRVREEKNWSDKAIAILTLPQIVSLLILVGFGGIWLELKMPGFGVPGTIAVIAFLLVFSSQFLIGNANALEILFFLIGLALLAIEIFVTPGFGVIGGAGIACVFLALLLAMQPFTIPDPGRPWQFDVFRGNLLATLGGIAGSLILLMLFAWLLPGTPIFRRLTLEKELRVEEGFSSGVQDGASLVGQTGVVVTALRPAGKLEIGDATYSVVSDAEFVDTGTKARILRVDGPKIVVEPVVAEPPKEPEFQA